jgi:hypothetical protein
VSTGGNSNIARATPVCDAACSGENLVVTAYAHNWIHATDAIYGPDSSLTGFVSGSGGAAAITSAFAYNKRLQPLTMSATTPSQTLYSIGYDFHVGSGNNGNVFGITNYKDTTHGRDQTFTYDALNRVISAQNAGTTCSATTVNGRTEYWGNSYGYDAWGNLLNKSVTKCSAENLSVAALTNNQLSGYGYDAAGNMTNDPTDGITLNYDPENRLTGASGYTYTYDGDRQPGKEIQRHHGDALLGYDAGDCRRIRSFRQSNLRVCVLQW